MINKRKLKSTEWEKYLQASYLIGLISETYRRLLQLIEKNSQISYSKMAKEFSRYSSIEGMEIVNRNIKMCLISLLIKEVQLKTTMKYAFMPVWVATILKSHC